MAMNRVAKTILTKRYGVGLVRFTHHPDCVIFSSANSANDSTFYSYIERLVVTRHLTAT